MLILILTSLLIAIAASASAAGPGETTSSTYFQELCDNQTIHDMSNSTIKSCIISGLNINNITTTIIINTRGYNITIDNTSLTFESTMENDD